MRSHTTTASVQADPAGRGRGVALWVLACASPLVAIGVLGSLIGSGSLGSAPTMVLLGVLSLFVLPVLTLVLDRRGRAHASSRSVPASEARVVEHTADEPARAASRPIRRVETTPGVRSGAA